MGAKFACLSPQTGAIMAAGQAMESPPISPVSPAPHHSFADDILAGIENQAPADPTGYECEIAPRELPPDTMLNGYRLVRMLGAGGFGVTYLAQENGLNRPVVIKESFPDTFCYRRSNTLDVCLNSPETDTERYAWACANFLREARILATLDHPYIAKVYSYFEAHDTAYYVTEYIDGQALGKLAAEYATYRLSIRQDDLLGLMVRLLDALDYLHGKKLLHRDIKPDNVLITRQGFPVLIDFGAARESYGDLSANFIESPGFTPPEQLKEGGNLGPWTDLYALGATLYYTLTGTCLPPCNQRELYDTAAPLSRNSRLLSLYAPGLLQSIDKACHPSPEARYASAAEWLADLHESKLAPASARTIAQAVAPAPPFPAH